jgi:hypothetical protein
MQVRVENDEVFVSDDVTLEELAEIIEEYDGYTIYITDEFDEETDIGWELFISDGIS